MEEIISGELHDEILKRSEKMLSMKETFLSLQGRNTKKMRVVPRQQHPKLLRAPMSTNDFLDIFICVKTLSECREDKLITL
jgi:hypothetical protein